MHRLGASWLVSTVTASRRASIAGSAPAAASSMACPPRAWTVISETPSRLAALTAPETVFGMSWYFRSRNTFSPRATSSRTNSGPAAVKSWLPTLNRPDLARQGVHEAGRIGGAGDVQRDDQPLARVHPPVSGGASGEVAPGISSVPITSVMRAR